MGKTNEEKLLSSIDGTLKDILKEIKKSRKSETEMILVVDGKELGKVVAAQVDEIDRWKEIRSMDFRD